MRLAVEYMTPFDVSLCVVSNFDYCGYVLRFKEETPMVAHALGIWRQKRRADVDISDVSCQFFPDTFDWIAVSRRPLAFLKLPLEVKIRSPCLPNGGSANRILS